MTAFDRAWEIAKESGPPLNRFDDETKQSFLELYDKVDVDVDITEEDVL